MNLPTPDSQQPKVSVVLPVLNGMATIGKAVDSILEQTEKNLEIVIVDDGSTDGTFDYVQSRSMLDPRIKLFRHEKNMGLATARNATISHASGEWIAIFDADDWCEAERFEKLLKAAEAAHADVVFDNLKVFDHSQNRVLEETHFALKNQTMVLNAETFFRYDNPLRRYAMGYAKPIFRKSFIDQHKIFFKPAYNGGEDFVFLAEVLLSGGKTVVIPEAYYTYVLMVSPTTMKKSPHTRTTKHTQRIIRGCDELVNTYAGTITPDARKALIHRRKIFELYEKFREILEYLQQKNVSKAVQTFARYPFALLFFVTATLRVLYTNLLNLSHVCSTWAKLFCTKADGLAHRSNT